MAATPHRIATTSRESGPSTQRGNSRTGSAPLATSNAKTTRPTLQPSARTTFVAPRFPEPYRRRSMPRDFPAMYAAGTDPMMYDRTTASAVCMSARLASQHDSQRVAREAPRLSESVVEIPHVMLLHQFRVIAEDGDRRRRRL